MSLTLYAWRFLGDATRSVQGMKFGSAGGEEVWDGPCWEAGSFDRVMCDVPCSGRNEAFVAMFLSVMTFCFVSMTAAVSVGAPSSPSCWLHCKAITGPCHVLRYLAVSFVSF